MKLKVIRSFQKVRHVSMGGTDQTRDATASPAVGSLRSLFPAALLLALGLVGLAIASLLQASTSGWYLVIAPPGSSLADTINLVRVADGRLVQRGAFSNIVIAGSNRRDFPAALRHAGAWLAIAAPAGVGCMDPSFQEQTS
jgi:hypothetical protein